MINRVLLRIKVLHIVYSFYKGKQGSVNIAEREFLKSITKTYELYFYLLKLIVEVTHYAEIKIDTRRNRLNPTEFDLNPNTRFINNAFVKQLSYNTEFQEFVSENKISWINHQEIVKEIYELIVNSELYEEYMSASETDYEKDKNIWKKIFKKIILTSDSFEKSIEDQDIYWVDNLDIIVSFVIKTIKNFDKENGAEQDLIPKFKNSEDLIFAKKLLRNCLENKDEYQQLISENAQNWDLDRIAFMDIIIMQLAIAELISFPTIPVNVTMNEYIEISKFYSTKKSATFINGILDKITKELKKENRLIKVVKI
ncbi:MAG: transcription antitermination factor NusB [Paludibacter sp.]|nr:MAG: transcription antitermination factor NusB [Paludibacter sp.]